MRSASASMPRSTSTWCLVEHAFQPDLFGRHDPCKSKARATQNAGQVRVIRALRAGMKRRSIKNGLRPFEEKRIEATLAQVFEPTGIREGDRDENV